MKTTLLFLFAIVALADAQTISEYYGHLSATPNTEGVNHRAYVVVESSTPIDQSPSGANAAWNFTNLTALGPTVYSNAAPSAGEASTYPGTTMVTTNINMVGIVETVSKLYTVMNQAFTGVSSEATGINLNYTDNATIGTFPLTFGYTNTDAIAGTFTYTSFSGTFTGSMVSSVDAYGTLTTNDYGFGPNEITVVRLKTVQTMNLNSIVPNVGTASVTSYHYYVEGQLFPFFTSATTTINVPILSINQTVSAMEAVGPQLLGAPGISLENGIVLAPNPVSGVLQVRSDPNISVNAINITDTNGRTVVSNNSMNAELDLSNLSSGLYFARIDTDGGSITKKFIKQ